MVWRRGAHRPEEQDHATLGAARNATFGAERTASTYIFGAICPKDGKGAALILPACNTAEMPCHLAEIATEAAPGRVSGLAIKVGGQRTA